MTTTEQPLAPQKTKVEKAQSYVGLASTSLGVIGAVGTAFVWLITTFCVGDVQINPDKPVPTMMLKVIDSKGQQSTCYSNTVSLMPGKYHLEFGVPDKQPTEHADVNVSLWKKTEIAYTVPAEFIQPPTTQEDEKSKKKWWQFWKRAK
jgi:hypothetical protein